MYYYIQDLGLKYDRLSEEIAGLKKNAGGALTNEANEALKIMCHRLRGYLEPNELKRIRQILQMPEPVENKTGG